MSFISQIPQLNNIQFVPVDIVLPSQYHQLPFDKEWFKDYIKEWQTEASYQQPIQMTDRQFVEIHAETNTPFSLFLYNCEQEEVVEIESDFIIHIGTTNTVYVDKNGNTVQLAVHKWSFTFGELSIPAGTYYLYAPILFGEDDTKAWISEPLNIKTDHEDTIYIEAYNDTNKGDVIFKFNEPTGFTGDVFFSPVFGLRVYGSILDPSKYDSIDIDFLNQQNEVRQAYSDAGLVKELYVGGSLGAPPYVLDKVNRYLCCDHKMAEGREISKDEGAQATIDKASNYPLYTYTIDIRDYDRQDAFTDNRGALIDVHEFPAYPFYVWDVEDETGNKILGGYGWHVTDGSIRAGYVGYLNTVIAPLNGYKGEFIDNGTTLQYQQGLGDSKEFEGRVLTHRIQLSISALVNDAQYRVGYASGYFGFVWDDVANSVFNFRDPADPPTYYDKDFATIGTYNLYVFQDESNLTSYLGFHGLGGTTRATSITGSVSPTLGELDCRFNDFGSLDLGFIQAARTQIRRITFFYCGITDFVQQLCTANPQGTVLSGAAYFNWVNLTYYVLPGNALDSTQTTDLISDLRLNTQIFIIKTVNCRQVPAAPLNSPATTYKTQLQAAGWTVNTD